ncbi:hypothetical protein EV361DRAFT_929963 [Lentinula raphanica]|nr:hypothetical protein EV361DRAFT_929963 [Lentinula raphanica]
MSHVFEHSALPQTMLMDVDKDCTLQDIPMEIDSTPQDKIITANVMDTSHSECLPHGHQINVALARGKARRRFAQEVWRQQREAAAKRRRERVRQIEEAKFLRDISRGALQPITNSVEVHRGRRPHADEFPFHFTAHVDTLSSVDDPLSSILCNLHIFN